MDDQFVSRRHRKNPDNSFRTPAQVAAKSDEVTATPLLVHDPELSKEAVVGLKDHSKKKFDLNFLRDKKVILVIFCSIVVLAGAGLLLYSSLHKSSLNLQLSKINALYKPVSKTVASNLSGLQVDPSLNKLPVTAVMIENSTDARPQSGLGSAMVVFEAVAEGGVTRFMALYQDTSPSSIGPIRSARPYYVSWALGFDAAYAHVGGSPDALADITSWNVKDLNQFYNSAYYQRVTFKVAPHNVYSSISQLNQLEFSKGFNTSNFTSWTRKAAKPLATPTVNNISMVLSGPIYYPSYIYDKTTNSYNRSEDSAAQIDADTNTQISPKVVIAIVVPESQGALDATGAYYSNYNYIGSGAAYVFQDGGVTMGSWTKSTNNSQIVFTDSAGKPLPLDPGQTWVTAVTASTKLTYN